MTLDNISLMSQLISEQRFEDNGRGNSYKNILTLMNSIDDVLTDEELCDTYTNFSRRILRFSVDNVSKIHAYHLYRFCCGITHSRSVNTGFKVWNLLCSLLKKMKCLTCFPAILVLDGVI